MTAQTTPDCQQTLLVELLQLVSSAPVDEARLFSTLCELYFESLSNSSDRSSSQGLSAEWLFAEFPALAHSSALRGHTLWAELTSRVSFLLEGPTFARLYGDQRASAENKLLMQEIHALVDRFPGDAAGLKEQMSIYCLVRDKAGRSDVALQNIDTRYTPIAWLGSGWFGSVYLAWDEALDRDVAIKIPYPTTLDSDLGVFLNEARNAAQLQHENIARVIDFAQTDSSCYIIYEFVRNAQDLDVYCQDQRPSVGERLELLRQICNGLAHAHRHKIIHRDLKPANILVSEGQIRLADFGLSTNQNKLYRQFNERAGTLDYMSPEQKSGEVATDKSDIYSLGIIAAQMFADCAMPRQLKQLIHKCVCKQAPARPSAEQCLRNIEQLQHSRARRKPLMAAALIVAMTAGGITGIVWRNHHLALKTHQDQLIIKLEQFADAWQNELENPRSLSLKSHAAELKQELIRSKQQFRNQLGSGFPLLNNNQAHLGVVAVIDAVLLSADGQQEQTLKLLNSTGPLPDEQWRYEAAIVRGRALQELRRWPEAYQAFNQALQIKPTDDAMLGAAQSALHSDDISTAVALHNEALQRLPQGSAEPHVLSSKARFNTQLSEAYYKSGQTEQAVSSSQSAVKLLAELSQKHDDYKLDWGLALFQLANLQQLSSRYDDAVDSFQQCEAVLRKLVDRDEREAVKPHLAKALIGHSATVRKLYRYDEGLALANEANENYKICIEAKLASEVDRANALLEIASCLYYLNRFDDSVLTLKEAEGIYRQTADDSALSAANLATTLSNLALVLHKQSGLKKSEELMRLTTEAIQIFEKLESESKLNAPRRQELARAYHLRSMLRGITKASSAADRSLAMAEARRAKELVQDDLAAVMLYSEVMQLLGEIQRTIDADGALATYTEAIDKLQSLDLDSVDENLARLHIERVWCRGESSTPTKNLMLQDAQTAKRIAEELQKTGNPNADTYIQATDIIIKIYTPENQLGP